MANLVAVKDMLAERGIESELKTVRKNGVEFEGLMLDLGEKICPCLYNEDGLSDEELLERCLNAAETEAPAFDVEEVFKWESAKKYLRLAVARFVGEEILQRDYLDMKVFYEIEVSNMGVSKVTKELLKTWDVSEDEVHEVAVANSVFMAESLEHKMAAMMGFADEDDDVMEGTSGFYVITNNECFHGAGAIFKFDEIRRVAERIWNDLLVIPSSIHEILCVDEDAISVKDAKAMVTEVNDSEVKPEDRLSYSVYRYSREEDRVMIAS